MRGSAPILARILVVALCVPLWLASNASAQTISAEAFLASPAAVAFKQGRFDEALAEFDVLLAAYPGDLVLLRYIGMTLDRLERYQEAVEAYQRGLERSPEDPALHFFSGITAFKLRDLDRATAAFRRVVALSADTVYGERARDYLQALEQQKANFQRPGAPRRWDLVLQVGSQYDSNASLSPESAEGDRNTLRFFESLVGAYDIFRGGKWRLRAEASTYNSQNIDEPLESLNVNTLNGALALSYADTIWGRPITPSLKYGWGVVLLEGNMFSDTHRLESAISVNPTGNTLTRLYHELNVDNFREHGFDPGISSRDAWVNTFGLTQYLFFDRRRYYVWAGYRLKLNDAEGVNFDSHTHRGEVGASLGLPFRFRLDGTGAYGYQLYDHFSATFDRRAARIDYSLALSRPIVDGLSFSLGYNVTDEDSNFEVLEYDQQILTLSLGYRL